MADKDTHETNAQTSLLEAGSELLAAPNADALAKSLVQFAVAHLGAESAAIWTGSPGGPWSLRACQPAGAQVPFVLGADQPWRSGPAGPTHLSFPVGDLGILVIGKKGEAGSAANRLITAACTGLAGRIKGGDGHAEVELLRTVTRLETVIRHMSTGLLVENEHRRIALVNSIFCDLFGIPVDPELLVGTDCSGAAEQSKSLFADPEGFVARIDTILADQAAVYSERLAMADGRIVERDYIPVIADGSYSGHLWVYRDVTLEARAATEVSDTKRFYEQVLEAMPAQLAVFDSELRYRYLTPSAVRDPDVRDSMLGKTDEEYCADRGIDPEVGRQRMDRLAGVLESGTPISFEEGFETPTGGHRHFLRFISPIVEDGQISHLLGYGLDVSDRRTATVALRRGEALMRAVLEASFDAIITADSTGTIQDFNPAAERIFGHPAETARGSVLADLIVPEELQEAHRAGMARYVSTGESRVLGKLLELPALRADGSTFPAEVFIRAIQGYGNEQMFTAFIRDVSIRQETEERLDRARTEAESATRATERFLATISHEMRTPLNAVTGMTYLLEDTSLDAQQADYLAAIRFSSDHLLSLINDILDVAKIQSGHLRIDRVAFNLHRLVRSLGQSMAARADEKLLQFEVSVGRQVPEYVKGDPVRLSQILVNLVGNAIKFTSKGHVRLSAGVSQTAGETVGPQIRFEVKDSGIGISEEELVRMFEPFTQAEDPQARIAGGTGLGLHIVRELVTLQDGTISIDSREGEGTTVAFEMPFGIAGSADVHESPLLQEIGTPLAGRRILVVEDNELNQAVATGLLARWGADADVAQNGALAIERLDQKEYDLVLMDVQMPVMDGFEATRRIRSNTGHWSAGVPIVALTASVLLEDRDELIEAGMNDFVLKPFDPVHLLDRILTHLEAGGTAGDQDPVGKEPGTRTPADTSPPPAGEYADAHSGAETTSPPQDGASTSQASEGSLPIGPVDVELLDRNTLKRDDLLRRLVALFLENTPAALVMMERAAAAGDLKTVGSQAHSLKSGAGMLGATGLQRQLQGMEAAARDGKAAGADIEAVALARSMYESVEQHLRSILSKRGLDD